MLTTDLNVAYSLDYDLIYSLMNKFGVTKKTLSEHCHMSADGFARALKNQTLDVKSFELIAAFFQKHPGYFFGPDPDANAELTAKVNLLTHMLEEKKQQLKDKEEIIRLLKQQLK